jgi:hypothetical protein
MLKPTEPQGLQLLANARHREGWLEVLNRGLRLLEQAQLVAEAFCGLSPRSGERTLAHASLYLLDPV